MIVLPVISRELRASSRHAFTYHLRTLGVGLVLFASVFFGLDYGFAPTKGGLLFESLHFTLFCSIWILVPLLTADCISRERREGTLGLLFLTALKSRDIVVAKSFAHGLRALTLWLAVIPVVTIPFLMGGLNILQALMSACVNFSAICFALSAGLLASTIAKSWLQSVFEALLLSVTFILILVLFSGWTYDVLLGASGLFPGVFGAGRMYRRGWGRVDDGSIFVEGLYLLGNAGGDWLSYASPGAISQLTEFGLFLILVSLVVLFLAILLTGFHTRRIWQEEPPSAREIWIQKTFCTPVFWLSFFRKWMRRKLEHNPVGWLEQRTWSGRLITWGWLAVVISLYSAVLTDRSFFRGGNPLQSIMGWLLAGSMALSAAGSFRRERESGVLELLLVSPLAQSEIVNGRLRGLWGQFLPAFGILLGLWSYVLSFDLPGGQDAPVIWFFGVTFVTIPIIGLYFSLRCRTFIGAFFWTFIIGGLIPSVAPMVVLFLAYILMNFGRLWFLPHRIGPSLWASAIQILFAVLCWNWLHDRLRRRAFRLERDVA